MRSDPFSADATNGWNYCRTYERVSKLINQCRSRDARPSTLHENRTFGRKYRASEKKARERAILAPRGVTRVQRSDAQKAKIARFWKRDLPAENRALKGPGGRASPTQTGLRPTFPANREKYREFAKLDRGRQSFSLPCVPFSGTSVGLPQDSEQGICRGGTGKIDSKSRNPSAPSPLRFTFPSSSKADAFQFSSDVAL